MRNNCRCARELQGWCLLLHWIKKASRTRELHSRIQVKLMQFSLLPRNWHFGKGKNCSTVNPKLLPNSQPLPPFDAPLAQDREAQQQGLARTGFWRDGKQVSSGGRKIRLVSLWRLVCLAPSEKGKKTVMFLIKRKGQTQKEIMKNEIRQLHLLTKNVGQPHCYV